MARIRTIKPDLGDSEDIAKLSLPARYFFVLLLCFLDDEGRAKWSPKKFCGEMFACDENITPDDVTGWRDECIGATVIQQYMFESQTYICAPAFLKHQVINKASKSRLPAPPPTAHSTHLREASRSIPGALPEASGTEVEREKEKEGKGLSGEPIQPVRWGRFTVDSSESDPGSAGSPTGSGRLESLSGLTRRDDESSGHEHPLPQGNQPLRRDSGYGVRANEASGEATISEPGRCPIQNHSLPSPCGADPLRPSGHLPLERGRQLADPLPSGEAGRKRTSKPPDLTHWPLVEIAGRETFLIPEPVASDPEAKEAFIDWYQSRWANKKLGPPTARAMALNTNWWGHENLLTLRRLLNEAAVARWEKLRQDYCEKLRVHAPAEEDRVVFLNGTPPEPRIAVEPAEEDIDALRQQKLAAYRAKVAAESGGRN